MDDSNPLLILASSSPRRIEFLNQTGIRFQLAKPEVDETPRLRESPKSLVQRLSASKAYSVAESLRQGSSASSTVILAADTIVVSPLRSVPLGKPRDEKDAARMLRLLSGKSHTVLTSYFLLLLAAKSKEKKIQRTVATQVTMCKLSSKTIQEYIDSGEPLDKAGAYAIQGTGSFLIESIRGSYTNVVGLPMAHLLEDLKRHFAISPKFLNHRIAPGEIL